MFSYSLMFDNKILENLNKINVIMGKNGCGKSKLLRSIETISKTKNLNVEYIIPERAGIIENDPNVAKSMESSSNWTAEQRRANQYHNFKKQTYARYRQLIMEILFKIHDDNEVRDNHNFDLNSKVINILNSLLDNIDFSPFKDKIIFKSKSGIDILAKDISSGESEIITLGIECLYYAHSCQNNKMNLLLLDEPDVHLHPDLQYKFGKFLLSLISEFNLSIIIATHSTAFLSSISDNVHTRVCFMKNGSTALEFTPISDPYTKILPIFGAHPLSSIFNRAPILLVEGEDDERIWQQAIRTSNGKIKLFPCQVDSIQHMREYEKLCKKILNSIYDNPVAFSLRDRDSGSEEIDDDTPIIRMKLSCYSAENLLLTDDILYSLNYTWHQLKLDIDKWIEKNSSHAHFSVMKCFQESKYNRKNFKIKAIRNDVIHILETNKSWEIVVGQAIARLDSSSSIARNSLKDYLGKKTVKSLLPHVLKIKNT